MVVREERGVEVVGDIAQTELLGEEGRQQQEEGFFQGDYQG